MAEANKARNNPSLVMNRTELLQNLAASNDIEALAQLLGELPLSEALRELLELSWDVRTQIFSTLPSELAAALIEEAPDELAVERLDVYKAAEIIDELDPDAC